MVIRFRNLNNPSWRVYAKWAEEGPASRKPNAKDLEDTIILMRDNSVKIDRLNKDVFVSDRSYYVDVFIEDKDFGIVCTELCL